MHMLWSYKRGSISRRHFLGVTGLGVATAVLGAAMPGLRPRRALAQGSIGDRVVLATWPNYHDPANFDAFTEATGAQVQVNVFGSNEEMLAKLQAGGSGWDVFVPTNYTITTYVDEGLIEPLDTSRLPNYDAALRPALRQPGHGGRHNLRRPKNWGTTGFAVNTKHTGGTG
jgi:spermidine/putrescine transport system substrate-binding protein